MLLRMAIALNFGLMATAALAREAVGPAPAPRGADLAPEVAEARARQATLMRGELPIPEDGFYVTYIGLLNDRADFQFSRSTRLAVVVSPGAVIWGWTVVGVTPDPKHAFDGFVTMKPPDGGGEVHVWTHLGVVLPQNVRRMDFEQWQHHATQPDALLYRAAHRIVVVNKPDGAPDDEEPAMGAALPKVPPVPDKRDADAQAIARIRDHFDKALGAPLPEGRSLPDVDFYLTDVDPPAKKITVRFPAAPSAWVAVHPGDSVCGWIVTDLRADPAGGPDAGAALRPAGFDRAIDVWKRLPTPAANEVVKMDAARWARHQFEPDALRLRSEGRILVSGERTATDPSTRPTAR